MKISSRILPVLFAGLVIFSYIGLGTYADEHKHHVLFLQSYDPQNAWSRDISLGFYETINSERGSIEVHEEYMDTKRRRSPEDYVIFTNYLSEKYANIDFSVIVTADNNAFNFVRNSSLEILDDIPVVFCGLNPTSDNMDLSSRYTGIYETLEIQGTLDVIQAIHPDDSTILIISDETVTGQAVLENVKDAVAKFDGPQDISFFMSSDMNAIEAELTNLDRYDAVLLLLFNVDKDGRTYSYNEGLDEIYKRSLAPIYGMWKFYLSEGIIGGYLTDGHDHGRMAAEQVVLRLKGETASPMVQTVEPKLYFDYLELKQYGLESIALPNNATVINRPTESFREQIPLVIGTASVTVLLVIVVALWYIARKERLRIDSLSEEKLRLQKLLEDDQSRVAESVPEREAELIHEIEANKRAFDTAQNELKVLRNQLSLCRSENRLASMNWSKLEEQLVHMDMVHRLFHILFSAAIKSSLSIREFHGVQKVVRDKIALLEKSYEDGNMTRTEFESFIKSQKQAIDIFENQMEALVLDMDKQTTLERLDISEVSSEMTSAEIIAQAAELAMLQKLNSQIESQIDIQPDLAGVKRPFYLAYIVIQLVSNALDHGLGHVQAGRVSVRGYTDGDSIVIEVSDTGAGMSDLVMQKAVELFYTTRIEADHMGIGLSNILGIVEGEYGGRLEIESAPSAGTTVKIVIPGSGGA